MSTLAEFITSFATKAGVAADNEALKTLNTNPELAKIALDDSIEKAIYGTFMTKEAAKNNPDIKAHFFAAALDGIDSSMKKVIDSYELTDEEKKAYEEKRTHQRVEFLSNLIKEKEASKALAVGGEKKVLVEEVQKLQGLLKAEKEAAQKAIDEERTNWTNKLSDLHYDNMLSTFAWANKDIPSDVHKITLRTLAEEELKKKGATMIYKDGQFLLKNASSTDLDYMENGTVIPAKDFITRVAAEKKLLAVSEPNPNPNPNPNPRPAPIPAPAGGGIPYDNSIFNQLIEQSRQGERKA